MPIQERSSIAITEASEKSVSQSFTGLVHIFRNPAEFIQVKANEFGTKINVLAEAFRNRLMITERCFNRLCGAPPSAHRLEPSF